MPKVLLVFPVSEIGGGENVLLNLVRFRERADIDYSALILSDVDGPLRGALTELGVPHVTIPRGRMRRPLALVRALRAARKEISRAGSDVLLSNSSQGYLYARWASAGRVAGALYFMSVPAHGTAPALDAAVWRMPPDRIFAASETIKRALEQRGMTNVCTVYHGVPEPSTTPEQRHQLAGRLGTMGIPPDARIVLMPGRLQRWKGQLAFVRAFAPVAAAHSGVHGVILGGALFGRENEFTHELAAEICRLRLETRVHLAGHDAIAPWLERASCVVHASQAPDAFPNVCIEALAAHRPLITNTECGVAEILTHGRDAWVVRPRDDEALSRAMCDVLNDPHGAERIAEAGYETYTRRCTPSHMVRPIEAALCAL